MAENKDRYVDEVGVQRGVQGVAVKLGSGLDRH